MKQFFEEPTIRLESFTTESVTLTISDILGGDNDTPVVNPFENKNY